MPAPAASGDHLANSGTLSTSSTLYAEDPLKNSGAQSSFSQAGLDLHEKHQRSTPDSASLERQPSIVSDGDAVGLGLYHEGLKQGELEADEGERKAVLKKLDLILMPILCITYGLQYLDKTALNYGNLFGLSKGMNLKGNQFNQLASCFYYTYLVFQPFALRLVQRYPANRVMFGWIFTWGIVVMSTAACRNFAGGMVNRLFLGMLEAGLTPTLVLLTGTFWTHAESPFRQLFWYSFQGWAGIVGSLLSYGLGQLGGALQPWEYIFLLLGAVTILWSFVVLFYLPDSPATVRYFTPRERLVAVQRVATNKNGIKNKKFQLYQVKEAALDPKTYCLFFMAFGAQLPNGLISSFSTVIIKGLGFGTLETTLLGIPPNVIQVIALLVAGWVCSRFKNMRVIVMTVGNLACLIAAACMCYLPTEQKWQRLVCFWITPSQSVGFSLMLVMVSSNVGGYTKKTVLASVSFLGYCAGNIAGPQFFNKAEAPRYDTAIKAMLSGYVIKTFFGLALGAYMWNENRRRDKKLAGEGKTLGARDGEEEGMNDLTENQNPHFRYLL